MLIGRSKNWCALAIPILNANRIHTGGTAVRLAFVRHGRIARTERSLSGGRAANDFAVQLGIALALCQTALRPLGLPGIVPSFSAAMRHQKKASSTRKGMLHQLAVRFPSLGDDRLAR